MPEGSTSSRTDHIKDRLLTPGPGNSAYSDPLSGDSPTASSSDTYIQIDDYAAHQHADSALSPSLQQSTRAAAGPSGFGADSSALPQAEQHCLGAEGGAETAHSHSGDHIVMDVLTTQEPVTANGTADGAIETTDSHRDSSVSPQPTRESGHGDVPTDVEEVPLVADLCLAMHLSWCGLLLGPTRCMPSCHCGCLALHGAQ